MSQDLKKPGPIHVALLKERLRQVIEQALKPYDQIDDDSLTVDREAYKTALQAVTTEVAKLQGTKQITTEGPPRALAGLFVDWYYEQQNADNIWPIDRSCDD